MDDFTRNACTPKRLGIMVCYDKQGVIDDYICCLLEGLSECLSRLVVVFNGELSSEGRKKLLQYTADVVERDNTGFDVGAWKFAIKEYIGWNELGNYDELLLVNDSVYGPFSPFSCVFETMEERNLGKR